MNKLLRMNSCVVGLWTKLMLLALLLPTLSWGGTWYADATRPDDSGAGTSWTTAKKTIQAAVDAALDGDSILVTNGIYCSGGAQMPGFSLSNRLYIAKAVTVQSVNGAEVTYIDGGELMRGVLLGGNGVLRGFSIVHGKTLGTGDWWNDQSGAGILLKSGSVENCLIYSNTAMYGGGGVQFVHGGAVNNSIVHNNSAVLGGGAVLSYGGEMNNCLIRNNSATSEGGGVKTYQGGTIRNCSIVNNAAHAAGGLLCFHGGAAENSIVWGNSASSLYSNIQINGSDIAAINVCAPEGVTNGINGCITNNPLFTDVENNDFTLQSNSPCINAGNNVYAPTNISPYDLKGNPRITGGTVDIGAYEWQAGSLCYITARAGAHGALHPSGRVPVLQGDTVSFALEPDAYYQSLTVLTNGGCIDAAGMTNFIWSDIQMDGTFDVTFGAVRTSRDTPLWWLAEYGMTQDVEQADGEDQDGDGMLTWQEYISVTVPTNKESVMLAETDVRSSGNAANEIVLTWLSGTNMSWRYSILKTVDFLTFAPVVTNLLPTPPVNTYTLTVDDVIGFYKIVAEE